MGGNSLIILNSETVQVLYQLMLAIFLGGLIGLERRMAKKGAGIRTYALVTLGSCLFSYLSKYGFSEFLGLSGFNPSAIASQVVSGVGFIGAGLIIFRSRTVSGLTTAAGLWVAAAIGMAVGLRFYTIAFFATVLTLIIFIMLWFVEKRIVRRMGDDRRGDV